ncbi:hypothetical protein CVT24_003014 [Panaeolus cyanescens]|uniref:Uncharacterized protein n=1 Tax=Panaeolus cyanescens TaxID=181874 RepID=A0A409VFT6_9AGAR|nr:hypothetical protein CVT24_003014 [Panaeolus cyanescens]
MQSPSGLHVLDGAASAHPSEPVPPSYSALPSSTRTKSSLILANPLFNTGTDGRSFISGSERPSWGNETLSTNNTTSGTGSTSGLYASPYPLSTPSSAWDSDTPECFSRAAPSHLLYPAFDPMYLVSKGKHLDKGFPLAAPPLESYANHRLDIHPFISHDVTETDWILFLHLIQTTASLDDRDIRRSQLPIIYFLPIVGSVSQYGIQQYLRGLKGKKVVNIIEMWNRHFFGPRRMRIGLVKGQEVLVPLFDELGVHLPPLPKDQHYRLFVASLSAAS